MIKAVIFDLDGTLADTLSDLADSTNKTIEKYGFAPHATEEYKMFAGNGMAKMIERASGEPQTSERFAPMLKDFLDYYREHYCDKTTIYDGVPQLIEKLKENGILTAVVTNKADEMAKIVVNRLYKSGSFNLIFGQRPGFATKPDPALTLAAMKELGVSPRECVFIGDSGMDVATGVNSGAVPVGELWGFRSEKELLENGARFIISRPDELLPLIERLNSESEL